MPETERPAFSENEIIPLLKEKYDLCCTVKELPGERDRNYLAQDNIGNLYVLKISNASESIYYLETQNQALECTAKFFDHGRIPSVIPDINGDSLSRTCSKSNSSCFSLTIFYCIISYYIFKGTFIYYVINFGGFLDPSLPPCQQT